MSNEKKNHDLNQQKDSKRNPYFQKENTTEMSENTYDHGYTLKSSNQALESQNNNQKIYLSSSNSLEGEYIENNNNSVKKNENPNNIRELSNSVNASHENEMNNEEYNDSLEEPLYIMTLELERGKSEKLRIYPNSDPYSIAVEFCRANNLDEDAVKYLTSEIENLINKNKFITVEENYANKNENLDDTQEEFIDIYNPEEKNYNENIHYDYGNTRNSSRYSNNSGKNYRYSNLNDVEYSQDDYANHENSPGFPLENSKKSNWNSKENFYNNPEVVNQENEENAASTNSNRKNYLSENLPYLVHEQITEVDEENNITIEKLQSSKTENDISRSPIEKENEIVDFIEDKNHRNNSNLINKVLKDEEYTENLLTSSGKSVNKEYNDGANLLKNKMSEHENISRSQENILEKEGINNINCRSNYNYFKNNCFENNINGSVIEKSRIIPNDFKYSDSQVYLRENISKDSYKNFNISPKSKNGLNRRELPEDKGKDTYLNSNNEEKIFTFKQPKDGLKDNMSNPNKNTNSNIESFSYSNKNFTFIENVLNNQDYQNDINLNYDYNQNMTSDLNKTIKKNKVDITNKHFNPLSQSSNAESTSPLKLDIINSRNGELNKNSNTKSSEKVFYIADNTNFNENNKKGNSKDKDTKSMINHPKISDRFNSDDINSINNNNIKIKDYDAENKEHPILLNNNKIKDKVSDYEINNNIGGRSSQNSFSIKRPNSRSKYLPLAERVNDINENSSNNSKMIKNNNHNSAPNYGYLSYSNINNKILNYKENENKVVESKESTKINNLKNPTGKECKTVSDNPRNNSNKTFENINKKSVHQYKDDSRKGIDNIDSTNINNFINSIENEITSIKGTQSSNNDRYDKETKDKSDLNNLNNLNNLIKVTYDKKNDESDVILNNNINTYNTQNNIQNTKSNVSQVNEIIENNYNQGTVLNENHNMNQRNNVYRKVNSEINDERVKIDYSNKKGFFSDDEYKNEPMEHEKSRDCVNKHENKEIYFPNTLYLNSEEIKNRRLIERNKSRKKESAYEPSKLYKKDRIVSLQEHKCISKKMKLKGLSIFDRLYKEAELNRVLTKKVLKEEENEIYSRNNKINLDPNFNFGEILYAREKISKEEKEKKLLQIKYEQDINQMKNLTFTPEIHEYNNVTCRYKYYLENHYEYNRIKENKINQIRINNNYKDCIDMNLNPSENINEEEKKDDQVTAHFLRNEKKREKLIKEENSKYTFHPKTGNIYHFDQNFEERQIFYSEISEKNIKQLKEIYENNIDLKTGQPYFKPDIISRQHKPEAAYSDTSNDNKDIFTKLYNQAVRNQHEKKMNANKLFYEINYGNKKEIKSETDIIYDKIKKEIFSKIFKILDYDYDEVITGNNIFFGMRKLDYEIKTILEPLAVQLKEENETLIESEFIRAMEDLYELSSYNDKRILIDFYKKIKHKSADKLVFERNNHSRTGKTDISQKCFDEHFIWNTATNPNTSINLGSRSKRKNHSSIYETSSRDPNNSFSFRPKINKKSEILAKKHDEKVVKEINQINRMNGSNNIDSDKFFKNTLSTVNSSFCRLGGIKEFTFNNFKNKSIMKLNQNDEYFDQGFEINHNYEQHFSSDQNFIHSNQQIKKGDHSNGTFINYN